MPEAVRADMHGMSSRAHRLRSPFAFLCFMAISVAGYSAASLGCSSAEAKDAATFWREGNGKSVVAGADYDPRTSLAPLVRTVQPSVVVVRTVGGESSLPPGFDAFGLPPGGPRPSGMASGFIVSAKGHILTNHHVVEHGGRLQVQLADQRVFDAKVVGSDPETDLALLEIDADEKLPAVVLGTSATLEVGDWVVAIGSPMGLEHTATTGIVSAKGRGSLGLYEDSFVDFIQLDAALAPGNSGGPLFNLKGEVVGINTAVGRFAAGSGPGFAIPIDQAKKVMPQLLAHGRVVRGWLGIAGSPVVPVGLSPANAGADVGVVYAGTPAAEAGLQSGDRITAVGKTSIANFSDLRREIADLPPGTKLAMTIRRGDESKRVSVTLKARPEAQELARLRTRGHERTRAPAGGLYGGGRPRLGISVRQQEDTLAVQAVKPGSLADELGLKAGDRISRINGESVATPEQLRRALAKDPRRLSVEVRRGSGTHTAVIER